MQTEILNIELNAKKEGRGGKAYKGIAVTYQPPEYQGKVKDPVTRFLFDKSEAFDSFKKAGLKVGDWVEITFDESKFKNPLTFTKIDKPAPQEEKKKQYSGGGGGYKKNDPDTEKRIARAVAIKEAVNIVAMMVNAEGYTKTNVKNRAFLVEEILNTARGLEPFLTLDDDNEDAVLEDLYGDEIEGGDQEEFEDE